MTELESLNILVTRPEQQAGELCQLIKRHGGQAKSLPVISILPVELSPEGKKHIENLDLFERVIVVSPNAARLSMPAIENYWPQLPVGIRWLAIGNKTRAELARFQIQSIIPDSGFTSEDLLVLPELQNIENKKILIIKGVRGREKLAEELSQRMASVSTLEVYKRELPTLSAEDIKMNLCNPKPDLIQASSGETLTNLLALANTAEVSVTETPLVVGSTRVAQLAKEKGFNSVIVAADPSNESMIQAIIDWKTRQETVRPLKHNPGTETNAEKNNQTNKNSMIDRQKKNNRDNRDNRDNRANKKFTSSSLQAFVLLLLIVATGFLYYDKFFIAKTPIPVEIKEIIPDKLEALQDDVAHQQEMLNQISQSNEHLINRLDQLSDSQRSQWLATEASSLIQLAHQRLVLVQDPKTAYTLLSAADKVLSQINSSDASNLRRTLARDMLQLKKASNVDLERVFMRLDAARNEITDHSLANKKLDRLSNQASIKPSPNEDEGLADKLQRKIEGFFIITHYDIDSPPVLTRQQKFFSKQQAIILIEQTQLALLQGKDKIYRLALNQTIAWVKKHLGHDVELQKTLIEEFTELKNIDISPALPDLQQSMKASQELLYQLKQNNRSVIKSGTEIITSTG